MTAAADHVLGERKTRRKSSAPRDFLRRAGGHKPPMLGRWRKKGEKQRANKQQADPEALAVEGDPRGGLQSPEYRHADPRDVVVDEGVAMSGPGGSPQEDESVE